MIIVFYDISIVYSAAALSWVSNSLCGNETQKAWKCPEYSKMTNDIKLSPWLFGYIWLFLMFSLSPSLLFSDSDGLVIVGVHSAKFPNEKVIGFHSSSF